MMQDDVQFENHQDLHGVKFYGELVKEVVVTEEFIINYLKWPVLVNGSTYVSIHLLSAKTLSQGL